MTEAEWLACGDGSPMLDWLSRGRPITTPLTEQEPFPNGFRVTDRKLRLFACACCRAVWDRLAVGRCRAAVEVGERYADGLASGDELGRAREHAGQAASEARAEGWRREDPLSRMLRAKPVKESRRLMAWQAVAPPMRPGLVPMEVVALYRGGGYGEAGARLLRCVFASLPFRPVAFSPAWLTSTVTALASQMYESRDFGALPILADALQDAGCDNDDILNHCHGPGWHVRGCWVVELVLGKA